MGDPLTKANSGDRIILSASTFNTIVDAVNVQKNRQINIGSGGETMAAHAGLVPVRNDSGSDLDQCGILGIASPLFSPTDNLPGFKRDVILSGVTPTALYQNRFAVVQGPIKAGKIGTCRVIGPCAVMLDMTDATHGFATVVPGAVGHLVSVPYGPATILWYEGISETSLGLQWAIVNLGAYGRAQPAGNDGDVQQLRGDAGAMVEVWDVPRMRVS
jgi:hypothetical protein